MGYVKTPTRTWTRLSDNDGLVFNVEYRRIDSNFSTLLDGLAKAVDYTLLTANDAGLVRVTNSIAKVVGVAFSVASPTVITSAAHNLDTGDKIVVSNSSAEEEILNGIYTITVIGAGSFSIPIDNTAGAGGTLDYRDSVVITLPAAATDTDREVRVIKVDANEGAVVMTDGTTEYDLLTQNQMVAIKSDGTNWVELTQRDVGKRSILIWRNQVGSGNDAGGFTQGDWRTRPMSALTDPDGIAFETGSQLTLPAGEYEVFGSAPAYQVNHHQCRVYDVTNAATLAVGSSENSPAGGDVTTRSVAHGRFVLAAQADIEFQHRCETTQAVDGMGQAATFGLLEGYGFLTFYKVA